VFLDGTVGDAEDLGDLGVGEFVDLPEYKDSPAQRR
jgi:hypothetical protein